MKTLPTTKYMLLDVTGGGCRLRLVAASKEVQLHARLLGAADPTRQYLAPPVEGRGFAKLTVLQLGELIKALGATPVASFGELCQQALKLVLSHPVDTQSLASLENEVACQGLPDPVIGWKTIPREEAPVVKKVRSTEFSNPERPKAGTTTGYIWELCDALKKKLKRLPTSKEAWEVCSSENIKQGTFSVQFGKWKRSME